MVIVGEIVFELVPFLGTVGIVVAVVLGGLMGSTYREVDPKEERQTRWIYWLTVAFAVFVVVRFVVGMFR